MMTNLAASLAVAASFLYMAMVVYTDARGIHLSNVGGRCDFQPVLTSNPEDPQFRFYVDNRQGIWFTVHLTNIRSQNREFWFEHVHLRLEQDADGEALTDLRVHTIDGESQYEVCKDDECAERRDANAPTAKRLDPRLAKPFELNPSSTSQIEFDGVGAYPKTHCGHTVWITVCFRTRAYVGHGWSVVCAQDSATTSIVS